MPRSCSKKLQQTMELLAHIYDRLLGTFEARDVLVLDEPGRGTIASQAPTSSLEGRERITLLSGPRALTTSSLHPSRLSRRTQIVAMMAPSTPTVETVRATDGTTLQTASGSWRPCGVTRNRWEDLTRAIGS